MVNHLYNNVFQDKNDLLKRLLTGGYKNDHSPIKPDE
jgi:hypothetical protein